MNNKRKKVKVILDILTIIACAITAYLLGSTGNSSAIFWVINSILWVVITFLDCIKG